MVPARLTYLEPVTGSDEHSPGIREFWNILRPRIGYVFLIGLVGAGLAGALAIMQGPVFDARTTLELQDFSNGVTTRLGDGGNETGPMTGDAMVQTQAAIFQSRSLARAVRARIAATDTKWNFTSQDLISRLRKKLGLRSTGTPKKPGTLPVVETKIVVRENTRLIDIHCESGNPYFAADYCNAMVQEYMETRRDSNWNAGQKNLEWMTRQLDNLKFKLHRAENGLQDYGRSTGILVEANRVNTGDESLLALRDELSRAQADRIAKQSASEVARASAPDSLPQIIDNGRLGGYETKLDDLKRELAELRSQYTPEHFKVVQVTAQIKELESSLAKERGSILSSIDTQYKASLLREELLTNAYAERQREVLAKTEKAINYEIQKREVDSLRNFYDELLKKSETAAVASAVRTDALRVIDLAETPGEPARPDLFRYLAMGAVSASFFGALIIVWTGYANRSISAPGESTYHLKLPELAVVPDLGLSAPGKWNAIPARRQIASREQVWAESTVSNYYMPSPAAEAYRSVVASLLSAEWAGGARVIMATSPERGDGKSTTVANLGIALSETKKRVLLIDGDLRQWQLNKIFGITNSWGMTDLLSGEDDLDEIPLSSLIVPTDVSNLSLIPAGPAAANIPQLLYSPRMKSVLERLKREFDFIVIDTPPMIPVSDARILGRHADFVILVVRAGKTSTDAAMYVKQLIQDDGLPLLGTILSGWDTKSKSMFGHYSASRGYYAAPGRKPNASGPISLFNQDPKETA
jgi:capsular exopolysaccharide synthesis family protein